MAVYTQCYLAYLDILGFKDFIQKKDCSDILGIFDELKRRYVLSERIDESMDIPVVPPDDIHYYIMSDSICIYISDRIDHAFTVLTALCLHLQLRMLCSATPILLRGSISRGEIYEEKGILFGPALVDAYSRAEGLAHTPRVIIPQSLYNEHLSRDERELLDILTIPETDGFYVTNYIYFFCIRHKADQYRDSVYSYINAVLDTAMNQSVRDKYLYLKTHIDYHFNRYNEQLQL